MGTVYRKQYAVYSMQYTAVAGIRVSSDGLLRRGSGSSRMMEFTTCACCVCLLCVVSVVCLLCCIWNVVCFEFKTAVRPVDERVKGELNCIVIGF